MPALKITACNQTAELAGTRPRTLAERRLNWRSFKVVARSRLSYGNGRSNRIVHKVKMGKTLFSRSSPYNFWNDWIPDFQFAIIATSCYSVIK